MRRFDRPRRRLEELSSDEKERLAAAHERLRRAVAAYDSFLGGALEPGKDVPAHDTAAMTRAQKAIEAAEAEVWHLREELLGWTRPAWAPRASAVTDWFSEDDGAYDDLEAPAPS